MSETIWRNCNLWLAQYDLTTKLNSLAVNYGADLLDITHFTDTTRRRIGGLKTLEASYAGFFDQEPDEAGWNLLGLSDTLLTLSPDSPIDGALIFFAPEVVGTVRFGADIGEILGIEARLGATGPLVRGKVAAAKATRSASGNGTAYQLGQVASGQKICAGLHVFSLSGTGPQLTVKIQSDDNSGMSSPVDRINFGAKTSVGGWFAFSDSPTTDTWWRATWTISGTSPQITFAVVFGIV